MTAYQEFLENKQFYYPDAGKPCGILNDKLFDYQQDIVRFAVNKGRSAIFADCGLGKTFMQLEWAKQIGGTCLILAPLAVSRQTVQEAKKIGIEVTICETQSDVVDGKINITNYEKLNHFDAKHFDAVILDESSILKSLTGKLRKRIIDEFRMTQYKLACTATPSPNDFMELGNHAEFIGVMTQTEMLSMFFVHDMSDTSKWRLKGHAKEKFWKWVCSWAVNIRKPHDIGYDGHKFKLPPIVYHHRYVDANTPCEGFLFPMMANTLAERRVARKASINERVEQAAAIANESDEQFLIWCNLNDEAAALEETIDGSVNIQGSDSDEKKSQTFLDFAAGKVRVLITKPKIGGFGMNWQNCKNVIFVGLSDSFEQFYQAVRRCYRFGQKKQVEVYIIVSHPERSVVDNIERKQRDFNYMAAEMANHTRDFLKMELQGIRKEVMEYKENTEQGDGWELHMGDCVETTRKIAADSVGFSMFSPPFASLYTYSNSERDMGNCKDGKEFYEHFSFLVDELYRVTMPGRIVAFHCMNLPSSKQNDGFIGLKDFRGDLIRMFVDKGFIYHSEVCIWKDPVIAMQRTKALGLLHKQIKKDSCMSRQGIPDYVIAMRKPGDNPIRVTHDDTDLPVHLWQKYASPVWMDINPSDTLQRESARAEEDDKHICPLQLEVIRRSMHLWSKKGDLVLSPFCGIGSEGHVAIKMDRKFIGCELKESYFKQAVLNIKNAFSNKETLFNVAS